MAGLIFETVLKLFIDKDASCRALGNLFALNKKGMPNPDCEREIGTPWEIEMIYAFVADEEKLLSGNPRVGSWTRHGPSFR